MVAFEARMCIKFISLVFTSVVYWENLLHGYVLLGMFHLPEHGAFGLLNNSNQQQENSFTSGYNSLLNQIMSAVGKM